MNQQVIIALAVSATALQFVDFYSSYTLFSRKLAREGNPAMQWLFNKIGIFWAFALTKAVVIAAIYGAYVSPVSFNQKALALGFLAAVYAWVAWNNLSILWRRK